MCVERSASEVKALPSGISRLILGTAQLGMRYGISNRTGQPDRKQAERIIKTAWENQVHRFDAAQAYGTCEQVLGQCFKHLGIAGQAEIILKIDPANCVLDNSQIIESIRTSLRSLQVPQLHALLLHRGRFLDQWNEKFGPLFQSLKEQGLIRYSGVSIYDEEEVEKALVIPDLNVIQLPFNIFDQRAIRHQWFERAQRANKIIHTRSVFLQGLLLLQAAELPPAMQYAHDSVAAYHRFCESHRSTPLEIALRYVWRCAEKACVVVGVNASEQLLENISILKQLENKNHSANGELAFPEVAEKRITNPSHWPASE